MFNLSTIVRNFLFVIVCLTALSASAQTPQQSLSTALNADGSIKPNSRGNFDPSGYRLTSGPNGEPRFVSASESSPVGCGDNWDTTFSINGANGSVLAIASDGTGNVYIGGLFTAVNNVAAPGVAKWNGSTWSALGSGINGAVTTLAVSGTDVYAAGQFLSAGGVPAKNVAKWNGSAWSALGGGLGGQFQVVNALAVSGSNVYAGGNFEATQGFPNRIARWDGVTWSSLGTGMDNEVSGLTVAGSDLYAVGRFGTAGGVPAARVAKWDGVSWTAVGSGIGGNVRTLLVSGTDIYIGGGLGGGIFKLNGTTWSVVGGGTNDDVTSLVILGSDIYAGGYFSTAGGMTANGIARWNGTQWSPVGTGLGGSIPEVSALAVSGSTIFAGGHFTSASGVKAHNIATLTAGTWSGFPGTTTDAPISAIAVSGTDVYVGGTFITAGSVTVNRIAKWNTLTQTWSALGVGITGTGTDSSSVNAIAVVGNKVYVGGSFPRIGGVTASGIAVWNGTAWAALGTGVNGRIWAIATKGDEVYVGGDFTTAGGVAANRVAKWNGTAWSGLNSSSIPNIVGTMAFMGNDLYVGTGTTTAPNPAYFSKYDGTNWTALGADLGDRGVGSIAVIGSDVYVTGGWTSINGMTVNRIAKWNGSTWSALGNGLPTESFSGISGPRLTVDGTDLIAVGDFTVASGGPANRIARWNGTSWSAFGTGLDAGGSSAAAGGDVFVGGSFMTAGCNFSPHFARWRQTVWTASVNTDWHTVGNWGSGSVPAANAGVTIVSADASITTADVSVGNMIVGGGRTITIGANRTLTVNGKLDLTNGSVAGAGNLIVNGDLSLNAGGISGLGSIVVNGSVVLSAGSMSGVGSVVINNGTLLVNGGNISNLVSLHINGNLNMTSGNITGPGPVFVTSCASTALVGGSGSSFIASPLTRCVNSTGVYKFPVATGSAYVPISLSGVTGSGNFTVEAKAGAYSDPAAGLSANRLQRWWQFTNVGITQANIVFSYLDSDIVGLEGAYFVYRINGGVAERIPAVLDTSANTATVTGVTSFSPWTMAEAPAANVFVGGQVTKPNGRGIPYVPVTITDGMGDTRTVLTNHSGYYKFNNIATPRVWTFSVRPFKRMTFTVSQKVVTVSENLTNVNFVSTGN